MKSRVFVQKAQGRPSVGVSMNYQGKVVIISGASSGIGQALAVEAIRQGARVGLLARRAELLQEILKPYPGAGAYRPVDVAHPQQTEDAVHELIAELGPPDWVIANAGVGLPSGEGSINVEHVRRMIEINYLGVVHLFAAALPTLRERRAGHLVAVSSIASYRGLPGASGYCASKAAVNTFCEALRVELRPWRIPVTVICPGFIDTAMTKKNQFKMPFLMSPERAATKMLHAVRRPRKYYNFPWIMYRLVKLTRWLPDRLLARQARLPQSGG